MNNRENTHLHSESRDYEAIDEFDAFQRLDLQLQPQHYQSVLPVLLHSAAHHRLLLVALFLRHHRRLRRPMLHYCPSRYRPSYSRQRAVDRLSNAESSSSVRRQDSCCRYCLSFESDPIWLRVVDEFEQVRLDCRQQLRLPWKQNNRHDIITITNLTKNDV